MVCISHVSNISYNVYSTSTRHGILTHTEICTLTYISSIFIHTNLVLQLFLFHFSSLNLNVDDIETATVQKPASHTPEIPPSSFNNKNFVQTFSNHPVTPPINHQPINYQPQAPQHHPSTQPQQQYQPQAQYPAAQPQYQPQAQYPAAQPTPYFNLQQPYQQQYVPPSPTVRPQQQPATQFQPVNTQQAAPIKPTSVQQPPPPPVNNINSQLQGQRNLNRGLKGSALRKLDHPTVPTCSACNQIIR